MKNTVFNGRAGVAGTETVCINRAVNAGLVALNGGIGVLERPKPYVEMPKVADTVKAVKEYSAGVLANAHITLRELKEKIASTVGVKLPSFKQLIALDSPVVAVKEVQGARITVYENGFASYEDHGAHTVIAVDRCGGYRYEFADGNEYIPLEVFEDAEWAVRLVMAGEKNLEHNRNTIAERNEAEALLPDGKDDETAFMVDFMEEENRAMLADKKIKRLYAAMEKLTERQMQVVQLYYFKEMTMQEIGDELGMTKVAVHYSIEGALKKLKKFF